MYTHVSVDAIVYTSIDICVYIYTHIFLYIYMNACVAMHRGLGSL